MNWSGESKRRAARPGNDEMRQFEGSQYLERIGGQQTNAWNRANTGSAAGTSANPIPMARVTNGVAGIRKRVPVLRYAGSANTRPASRSWRPDLKRNASNPSGARRKTGPKIPPSNPLRNVS